MPLYLEDKKATLFKGEHKPVNIYKGDIKITGWEYQEASGEVLNIANTYNDDCGITINGKSEQTITVQGKNLFDANPNGQISPGNTTQLSILSEGSLRSKALTAGEWKISYIPLSFSLFKGKTINVSCKGIPSFQGATGYVRLAFINSIGQGIGGFAGHWGGGNVSIIYSVPNKLPEGAVYFAIGFNSGTDGVGLNAGDYIDYKDIMVSLSEAPYEPFTPDSPSPDYPSPIESTGEFDLVNCGKNLFDIVRWYDWLRSYTTLYVQKAVIDGIDCIWYRPQVTYNQPWMKEAFKPNTSYTIMYRAKGIVGANHSSCFGFRYTDGVFERIFVENKDEWQTIVLTSDPAKTISFVQMAYGHDQGIYIDESSVMLVEGAYTLETMPTYKPYTGSTIHLPYTLRGLPNGVCDKIVIDNELRTSKQYQNIGEYQITGAENWYLTVDGGDRKTYTMWDKIGAVSLVICTHFKNTGAEQIYIADGYVELTVYSTFADSVDELKLWLVAQHSAGTPVTFQYQLATPVITELDYQAIKTFYPQTNIFTNTEIKPTLEGKFRVMEE